MPRAPRPPAPARDAVGLAPLGTRRPAEAERAPGTAPRATRAVSAAALVLGALAGLGIHRLIPASRGPLEWDEAAHVLKSHLALRALGHGDLAGALSATGADPLYPPLHAALLAGWFGAFGASEAAAYALSAASLAIAAALIAAIAARLGGWLAGLLAALFLLGAPLLLELTGTAMLELPGVVLALGAIAAFVAWLRRGGRGRALLAGVALAGLFFHKYSFGLLFAGGVAAYQIAALRRRALPAELALVWAPLIVTALAWLALPGRFEGFVSFAGNRRSDLAWLPSLLFYPHAIANLYAAGLPSAAMMALGLASAVRWRARPEAAFLFALAMAGLAAMAAHPYKVERSIVTVVPAVWLLAALGLSDLARALAARGGKLGRVLPLAALLAVGAPLPGLYARELPALAASLRGGTRPAWSRFPWPGRDLLPVQAAIVEAVDPRAPVYVAGEFNELAPPALEWKIVARHPEARVTTRCFSPETRWEAPFQLITIEVLPGSRYDGEDYRTHNAWALEPIRGFRALGVPPVASHTFAEAGVRVDHYRIAALPAPGP